MRYHRARSVPVAPRPAASHIWVETIPDRAFSGLGGPERLWNMQVQWDAAIDFSARVYGSRAPSRDAARRFAQRFDDAGTYFHCTMFYVQERVPG